MTNDPMFVNCCHCRQCQKITGSAFAMNGMIEADQVELLRGGGKLAQQAGQGRCSHCGTLLWATHPKFGDEIRFVWLGTLDESERIQPNAHFFVRSKHSWITIPPDLPQFQALPTVSDPPLMSAESVARLDAARGR
jgi:hypothetical protein